MMYFNQLGKIKYQHYNVVDITRRINFIKKVIDNPDFYYEYRLVEHETIETVAFDKLKSVDNFWIILLINEIYDPFYQWYMSLNEVIEYSKLKYGDPEYLHVHHWEKDGIKYNNDTGGATAISNLDYETELNDSRQIIKIPYPEYVNQIKREFRQLLKQ